MNVAAINEAINICLKEICSKLDEATRASPRSRGLRPGW
jgi:hypothetical protein